MRRPGPRPYECVRKAWHSDRHQPIRGSLIQEIFRVVNEVHSSATKKNKEWQEKLPVVVLKAEEIMYSKANSEAEYMDLKTLWDRTNDAINTIIRRDESTETGDLLQPCIEAALNLGCTPRRTSRSQRNCNPRCYLTPGAQEPSNLPPGMLSNMTSPNCIRNYSNLVKPSIMNLNPFGSECQNLVFKNAGVTCNKFPTAADNGRLFNYNQPCPVENHPVSNLCAVYPLYYGSCVEPRLGLGVTPESLSNASEPDKFCIGKNLLSINKHAALKFYEPDSQGGQLNQNEIGCDLSLRLGSLSVPLPVAETRELQCVHGNGHGSSQVMIKFKHQVTQADNAIDFRSSKLSEDLMVKKRKAIFCQPVDDQAYTCKPKLSCIDLTAEMKSRGL